MLRSFLILIVCVATVILFVQMHILNLHLSDFTNTIDTYMEQQAKFHEYMHHQQKQEKRRSENEDATTIDQGGTREHLGTIKNNNKLAEIDNSNGIAPILQILHQAGYDITNETEIQRDSLPHWSNILEAYGPPRILGLDSCQSFRDSVDPSLRNIGVAGLFNTGTNLLYGLLRANCKPPGPTRSYKTGILWQVPWGKHMPAIHRATHRVHSRRNTYVPPYQFTLPVVTVRDPYTWMQSMCRQSYAAQFDHSKKTCPNIIPYPEDVEAHPRYARMKYIPIHTKYDVDIKIKYDSLPSMWNEWYNQYENSTFPFLLIRMEDLVFHAEHIMPQVCECAGFQYRGSLHQMNEVQNKNHGIEQNATSQGLLRSIIQYGNTTNRRNGYTSLQLKAAADLLDEQLMKRFTYNFESMNHPFSAV